MRLDPETPARKALNEFTRPVKKKAGGQKITWFDIVYKDIRNNSRLDIDFTNIPNAMNELEKVCNDRSKWNNTVKCMMV